MKRTVHSLLLLMALLLGTALLSGCSGGSEGGREEEEEKSAAFEKGEEMARSIRSPVEKALSAREAEEERMRDLEEHISE